MTSRAALCRRRGRSDAATSNSTSRPALTRTYTDLTNVSNDQQPFPRRTGRSTTPKSSFHSNTLERVDSRADPSSPEFAPVFSPDSVRSPEQSFSSTPAVRSRTQSIAGGLSERFRTASFGELLGDVTVKLGDSTTKLGERIISKSRQRLEEKSQRKQERKQRKPSRSDLFEKPETKKLEKFWVGVEGEDFSQVLKRSIVHPHLNAEPGTQLLPPVVEEDIPPVPEIPRSLLLEQYKVKERDREQRERDSERGRDRNQDRKHRRRRMDASRLQPAGRSLADQQDKARRVRDAQDLYENIERNAERSGTSVPPYEFLELIGKGAFGRVYKCKDNRNGNLVAIKIVNIDEQDWSEGYSLGDTRDQTIKDFKKEVSILQQLKDNKAKNINVIHDAFDWHSQLWIVADYCTGGSVRTLMRPYEKDGKSQGLPEEYIVPIARELAVAMKSMHDLHIIHRDIKCANVYITEQGKIQLGDFGIVGVIDHDNSKRKTVIGTPHWMPREIVEHLGEDKTREGYGNEVDIWSYGCTIYEMATGSPPYSNKFPDMLPSLIQSSPPQLEGGTFSPGLRDLVKFCLNPNKDARPSAADIIDHPYLKDSSRRYPTDRLIRLIEKFKIWEHGGGSRASLWMASPADARNVRGEDDHTNEMEDELEDWNFSTSDHFDQEFTRRLSQIPPSEIAQYDAPAGSGLPPINTQVLTIAERIKQEHSDKAAARGENNLAPIFDLNNPSGYQLATPVETPTSAQLPQEPSVDLPLRSFTEGTRESMIVLDLDEADVGETATSTFAMHMSTINEDTIKPAGRHHQDDEDEDNYTYGNFDDDKRATMDWSFPGASAAAPPIDAKRDTMAWKFPAAAPVSNIKRGTMHWTFDAAGPAEPDEDDEASSATYGGHFPTEFTRPELKHSQTMPVGRFGESSNEPSRDSVSSMIDLDAGFADSAQHGSEIVRPLTAQSHMTDATSGNPFDLEDDAEQRDADTNRFSYHKAWHSEGGPEIKRNSHKSIAMHERGNSMSSSEAENPQSAIEGSYGAYSMQPGNMRFSALEQGLGLTDEEPIGNQWPNFSSYNGYETSPQYPPSMSDTQSPPIGGQGFPQERGLRATGVGHYSRSREPSNEPPRPEVNFPDTEPPHPAAMAEGADDRILEGDFGRVLSDLGPALNGVVRSLSGGVGMDLPDDEVSSDIDSGFDSNRDATEDEAEGLTARRNKARKPSPRLPTPQTFQ